MRKQRLSSTDIGFLIFDMLRDGGATPISVAVIPDETTGWRAVVARRVRMTPATKRQLAVIERRLQATVELRG
jgi:hypothetical protein